MVWSASARSTAAASRALRPRCSDLTGAGLIFTGFAGSITVANVTNGADFELLGRPRRPRQRPVSPLASLGMGRTSTSSLRLAA